MLVNNNVYTFISGIFVALSVNIFTSLCFEKADIYAHWHLYLSTLIFLLTGALCMYFAAKLSKFQNYIIEKHVIDYGKKREIVLEATKNAYVKWTLIYIVQIVVFIFGIILLVLNYIIN
ncbi:MAG: hypothetical protein NC240_01155 [Clostridium sp.]|nr:hypothetical protein [Clostridium sp.]